MRGLRFTKLVVIERAGVTANKGKGATWRCRCDCGVSKVVEAAKLLKGEVKSCGCSQRQLCAQAMSGRFTREQNPNWRGGRSHTSHGYVIVRVGTEHHLADIRGYAYEHRVVADLSSPLKDGEHVHHKNEVKHDNAGDNLQPLSPAAHARLHAQRRHALDVTAECNGLADVTSCQPASPPPSPDRPTTVHQETGKADDVGGGEHRRDARSSIEDARVQLWDLGAEMPEGE